MAILRIEVKCPKCGGELVKMIPRDGSPIYYDCLQCGAEWDLLFYKVIFAPFNRKGLWTPTWEYAKKGGERSEN
ncbi:MAG: hypothetical protein ACTSPV_00310 [Candidatus Hodarchaeales archaeon]